jgi:hypothetical protein
MADASQTPGAVDLGFRRGDEFRRVLTVNINLTGYTLTWEIFGLRDDGVKLSGSLSFTTPPNAVSLVISEAQTGTLLPGTYGFRAVWIATGSIQRTFLQGVCEVTR